jgi:hypothetical protein
MRWRRKIAEVAGMPPLDLMEGFYEHGPLIPTFPGIAADRNEEAEARKALEHGGHGMPKSVFENCPALRTLPISWDALKPDPLHALLLHSDCDGELETEVCGPIADRLEELLPLLPDEDAGGHIGWWREKTRAFIDGLRLAAAAGENVGFH